MDREPKDKSTLRTGFTTGACSQAAARAAAEMLASGGDRERVTVRLPMGRRVTFALERHERHADGSVTCSVVKDAGDDPDCTHGAHLTATVRRTPEAGVTLEGGDGVGTITRPGLGLPVGGPAINPVPREHILREVQEVIDATPEFSGGMRVTLAVPGGGEMAKHTLNDRLGIVGGISILGTTGIVRPYSTSAFRASVTQAIHAAAAQGCTHIAITTGGRSETAARALLPHLPGGAFVQMGDFVGHALREAARAGLRRVTIVGMIGKLSKLADGKRQTHAAGSQVNTKMLATLARKLGADRVLAAQIAVANTGRHAMDLATAAGIAGLPDAVCRRAAGHAGRFAGDTVAVDVVMTDMEGVVTGRSRYPGTVETAG
ncbi:MAG: cobalt-precorrin-5B (C(1))-methyltransferase [Nitrospirota bacterium]|nr:cobalt-precorrin-5B (C(1))-methyltransferase [Nitrospirota bacterium]